LPQCFAARCCAFHHGFPAPLARSSPAVLYLHTTVLVARFLYSATTFTWIVRSLTRRLVYLCSGCGFFPRFTLRTFAALHDSFAVSRGSRTTRLLRHRTRLVHFAAFLRARRTTTHTVLRTLHTLPTPRSSWFFIRWFTRHATFLRSYGYRRSHATHGSFTFALSRFAVHVHWVHKFHTHLFGFLILRFIGFLPRSSFGHRAYGLYIVTHGRNARSLGSFACLSVTLSFGFPFGTWFMRTYFLFLCDIFTVLVCILVHAFALVSAVRRFCTVRSPTTVHLPAVAVTPHFSFAFTRHVHGYAFPLGLSLRFTPHTYLPLHRTLVARWFAYIIHATFHAVASTHHTAPFSRLHRFLVRVSLVPRVRAVHFVVAAQVHTFHTFMLFFRSGSLLRFWLGLVGCLAWFSAVYHGCACL